MLQFTLRARHGRRLAVTMVSVMSVALLGASAAHATAPTSTSITSPSDPFFGFDQGQTQNVTISGTSNGSAPDTVDILCYSDNGSSGTVQEGVANDVSLDSAGNFSTSVPISSMHTGGSNTCHLRAVPHGPPPTTGLGSFVGPRAAIGYLEKSTSGSVLYDYYAYVPQITAADDYDSYSSCGLDNSYLYDPSVFGQFDVNGFYCNDFADNPSASNSARSGIEIDGQQAYGPYSADQLNGGASGLPSLTINSITQDSSNGDLTISETDPIVTCNNPCTAFSPSGVEVQRTISETDDGHIVYIDDSYSSTGGASHTVDLRLENEQDFAAQGLTPTPANVSYEFPGESTFAPHGPGDSVSVPATAPASILVENNQEPDGSTSGGRGAITYGQPVSNPFAFGNGRYTASTFDAANAFTVPASGSVPIRYAYSSEYTSAAAQQDAYTAEDKFQAAMVAISSPANGATVSSSPVTVTGTASAGSGVKSVTVNGVAATVSGGSFKASVPLTKGTNALTAVVTSNSGASGSASETVNLSSAKAPVVKALGATQVKTTTALLNGTVTPGSASTTYKFEYGKSTTYGKTTSAVTLAASSTAAAAAATISGLTPNTTYHFRLVASSSAGSVSSSDVKFRTAARPLKLSVSPGHIQAATRGCFAFKARSGSHGVSGVRVSLTHHKARTSKSGKAEICLSLNRGVYHPTATKSGYKTAHATIMVRPAKAAPTFTG